MIDTVKKALLAGVGAAVVTKDKIEHALDEFVRQGKVSADEARAMAWLEQPGNDCELLIVDIFLKGGSGLGVLRAVSGLANGPTTVVLSNYTTPDMRRKCIELGADRVFDKSHDIDALMLYCARLAAGEGGAGEPAQAR